MELLQSCTKPSLAQDYSNSGVLAMDLMLEVDKIDVHVNEEYQTAK